MNASATFPRECLRLVRASHVLAISLIVFTGGNPVTHYPCLLRWNSAVKSSGCQLNGPTISLSLSLLTMSLLTTNSLSHCPQCPNKSYSHIPRTCYLLLPPLSVPSMASESCAFPIDTTILTSEATGLTCRVIWLLRGELQKKKGLRTSGVALTSNEC